MRRNGYSVTEYDVDSIMWRMDDDKNGRVDYPEFSKLLSETQTRYLGESPVRNERLNLSMSRNSPQNVLSSSFVEASSPVRQSLVNQSFSSGRKSAYERYLDDK